MRVWGRFSIETWKIYSNWFSKNMKPIKWKIFSYPSRNKEEKKKGKGKGKGKGKEKEKKESKKKRKNENKR